MNAGVDAKTVVVTGVTSGIGAALAAQLLDAGASVLGVGRSATRLQQLSEQWGAAFVPVLADLADPVERARAFEQLAGTVPQLHAIVNNAAECVYASPLTLPVDRWRRLIEVDVLAAVELVRLLVPRLARDAHIVNISSVTTQFLANPRFAPYALAKTALEHFSDALRLELAPDGIAVTTIRVGLVATPLYDKVDGFAETRARLEELIPDWLQAEHVAHAILWCLTQPAPVTVTELAILPRGQAR